MNIYRLSVLIIVVIIFAHFFDVVEPISIFITRMADIPVIDDYGTKPHLFKLGLHLAYLIVIVAIVKMILRRNKDE